jgi:hypothetical protein
MVSSSTKFENGLATLNGAYHPFDHNATGNLPLFAP